MTEEILPPAEVQHRATSASASELVLTLAQWRSLDWRFLLGTSRVTTAGFLGPVSAQELAGLAEAGVSVQQAVPGAELDLVAVTGDPLCQVPAAVGAVRRGGLVIVRLDRAGVTARLGHGRVRGWERVVRDAGLTDIEAYWHAPHAVRCSYIVRIGSRQALSFVLRRHEGVPFGRIKSGVGRLLARVGLLDIAMPNVTLLARRPDDDRDGTGTPPGTSAGPRHAGSPVGTSPDVVITPWFAASRHVLEVALDPAGRLRQVAKRPRRPWDVGGIEQEGKALQDLLAQAPWLDGRIPDVLEMRRGPRPALVLSALHGVPADPDRVRRDPDTLVAAVRDFLDLLPRSGRTGDEPDWFARLIAGPLRDLSAVLPAYEREVALTLDLLEPLRQADLPLVLEHGDLSHPNMLLAPDGRLQVLDWERSEPRGLPLHDLSFALQYVAEARNGAVERDAQRRAFDEAFLGTDAWASPHLLQAADAERIDTELVPLLVLATWARTVAGLPGRLHQDLDERDVEQVRPVLAEVFAADRDAALWRHAALRLAESTGRKRA